MKGGLPLRLLPDRLAVCRLGPADALPAWADGPGFLSITRTVDELSIICDQARVPETVQAIRGWRALMVEGPLPFEMTGVMAALAAPLADAAISILPVATYDTDYLLVREETLAPAITALRTAGHRIAD